ncbi:hypothetical protein [Natronobiforma cellulositropha]|nr:hypothetical protein [Natronobiforma cellulositropha]
MSECTQEPRERDADDAEPERDDEHLDGIEVGAGCTEIWEHLAEQREE